MIKVTWFCGYWLTFWPWPAISRVAFTTKNVGNICNKHGYDGDHRDLENNVLRLYLVVWTPGRWNIGLGRSPAPAPSQPRTPRGTGGRRRCLSAPWAPPTPPPWSLPGTRQLRSVWGSTWSLKQSTLSTLSTLAKEAVNIGIRSCQHWNKKLSTLE